jgi:hypothetical protein
MRKFIALIVLLAACSAQVIPSIKVKLDMAKMDQAALLDKLNEHGKEKGLSFQTVTADFEYRIAFRAGSDPRLAGGTTIEKKSAVATVYDRQGEEIFSVEKNDRNTERGVMNAVSKDIIKKLAAWRGQAKLVKGEGGM